MSISMGQYPSCWGFETERHRRWAEAVPRFAMCLSEAGYPCSVVNNPRCPFHDGCTIKLMIRPPYEVLDKAAELCGIADLIPVPRVS